MERAARQHGFTLVEAVLAMVLFLIVATALAGALTSAIAANALARERTIAQQRSQAKIEAIRRLPYEQVGVPSGNPAGTVSASDAIDVRGLLATVSTQVQWVNDPTPTSYATAANYKRVTVTVRRDRDGKELSRAVTFVAPPGRAPFGGINNAIVNVQVVDPGLGFQPLAGATVTLRDGPSGTLSDTTDSSGRATFPALTSTTTAQPHYDVEAMYPGGYETLAPDDVPPAASARVELAPTQTFDTVLRVFRPATIAVRVEDGTGALYTGTTTLQVYSGFRDAWTTQTVNGQATITSLDGRSIVPGVDYTLRGFTATGLCADPAPKYVPDDYEHGVLTTTFVLVLRPCARLTANVKRSGVNQANATVKVSGGPDGISPPPVLTDGSGNGTVVVPPGSGYTVKAWRCAAASPRRSGTITTVTASAPATTVNLSFDTSNICPLP